MINFGRSILLDLKEVGSGAGGKEPLTRYLPPRLNLGRGNRGSYDRIRSTAGRELAPMMYFPAVDLYIVDLTTYIMTHITINLTEKTIVVEWEVSDGVGSAGGNLLHRKLGTTLKVCVSGYGDRTNLILKVFVVSPEMGRDLGFPDSIATTHTDQDTKVRIKPKWIHCKGSYGVECTEG